MTKEHKQDIGLVKKARKGSHKAFKQLYDKYQHQLFMVCLRYAKDKSQAEDFLQESFIKIFKGIDSFDPEKGFFEFWARKITINVCLENIRKKSLYTLNIAGVENIPTVHEDALSILSKQEMMEMIQEMPYGYKTVFNMYVIDGFSHKEIAAYMEISVGTSKSQLSKARNYLKNLLLERTITVKESHG